MTDYVLLAIVIVAAIIVGIFRGKFQGVKLKKYKYIRRYFFMSRAEHEFYDALSVAAGDEYIIFAQVHLPTLVDHAVKGQSWKGALAHINQKSVDFVLCDKKYISPKLAIELDDKTHQQAGRLGRDREVERILRDAGMPLLRFENHGRFDPQEISEKIKTLALK